MPKVSIIVPVYNVENYLEKCLNSLVNQTLSDIEIIVVNDGSPDESQKIIDTFATNYPNKIKAYTKKNGGLSDARNFGMKYATGDFIGFVDSDDFVSEDMFKKLYDKAISTDSDIVICAHNAVKLNAKNEIVSSTFQKIQSSHRFGFSIYESPDILAFARSYAWNKLYKKEVIAGFEFPKGQLFEDSAVVYNILSSAKKIELINEPLYYYVVGRAGAITSSIDSRIFDVLKSTEAIVSFYKKIGKYEELKQPIEALCIMHIQARFAAFRHKGSLKLKNKFIDAAFDFIEKYFPDWQNNPYYLQRLSDRLAVYPIAPFDKARESRKKLKKYFRKLYIKKLPGRILKKIGKFFKVLRCRILGVPVEKKSSKSLAKDLSPNELRELQLVTLDILKTVVDFCNQNGIRYYLSEGSLLGAIRHGGFIPWDDDLDIAMPRADYEKFLKLWGNETRNECKLYHQSTYKKYHLTFAKVVLIGKCRFSSLIRQGIKSMSNVKGPGIDIFPLDETGPLSSELLKRASKIRKYRNILLTKVYYIKNRKKRRLYTFKAHTMSYKSIQNKLTKLYTLDYGKNTEYITNFASSYNITKEIFKKEYFEPAREIKFEDLTVTVPYKSEEVLTQIYGDFMTPPPVEARVCPHQYVVKNK